MRCSVPESGKSNRPKSCLRTKQHGEQLASLRQVSPHCLTTSLRPQDFQQILPKSHLPAVSFPQKAYSNRPLRFLRISCRKCYCPKQAVKRNWRGLRAFRCESLPAAPASCGSYIFTDIRFEKPRKQPHFEKDSAGMEEGDGRLRKEISETRKLRRWTLGQQVNLSELKRVVHLLSLYLVRIRSFLVSLIPWSEAQSHPPSPQNTF